MPLQSIAPLPTQETSGNPENAPDLTSPDLSKIRQGWSNSLKDIPSIPSAEYPPSGSDPSQESRIPELPTIAALASENLLTEQPSERTSDLHPESKQKELSPLPEIPSSSTPSSAEARTPDSLSAMPSMDQQKAPAFSETPLSSSTPTQEKKTEETKHPSSPVSPSSQAPQEYTDQDLSEALQPIINPCVNKFLYTPTYGIHTFLEPMLRSTVRRAIAEQMEDCSPFMNVSGWDKFAWKLRALLSSRTYEDIVFDHTKRYQVEEVFLLRPHTKSLISYASNDPCRHAKPSHVQGAAKRIASKLNENDLDPDGCMSWPQGRTLMVRKGKHSILVAIVHGSPNAILRSDLDYALRQAEERFGKTLEDENDIHLQVLQPLLEGCLLIQAPAIPN